MRLKMIHKNFYQFYLPPVKGSKIGVKIWGVLAVKS